MKVKEVKQLMIEYCDVSTFQEVLEGVVFENFHNPAVCISCQEIIDVEPDYYIGKCHTCGGKTVSATHLGGIF